MEPQISEQINEAPVGANSPTIDDLLRRAKDAIDAGEQSMRDAEQSLRDAAEALADAQQLHCVTQAEMARAIGKSEAWVSNLLQWKREGYKGDSPFGPKTKAGRLKHAEGRTAAGASKPRKSRRPKITQNGDAGDLEASEPVPETAISTGARGSISRKPSPEQAKCELRYAIDHWWNYLGDRGKAEITKYFLKKAGVEVS